MFTETRIEHNFSLARNASKFSTYGGGKSTRIGCVIFYKNRPLIVSWNTNKELPMQKKYNSLRGFDSNNAHYPNYGHAEMNALVALQREYDLDELNINKLSIFIYREIQEKAGEQPRPALAKPCLACEQALRDIGIKNIYYTGNNSFIYEKYED